MSYTVNDVVKLYSDKVNDHNVLVDDYNDLLEWAQQAYAYIAKLGFRHPDDILSEAPNDVRTNVPADVRGEGS